MVVEIAPVHRVHAGGIDFEREQRLVGDRAVDRARRPSTCAKSRTRLSSRPAMRGVPRARRAISSAPSAVTAMPSTRAPRLTISSSSSRGVEIEPHRNAEAVAQRRGEQARARGRADQREAREIDLHRARRRPLADDQVELEILHRRIEDFLDRRIEPVDLVDEQHVAVFEIGQQRREVAGLGDDRAGGGAEVHAEFARDDLRQRGLAEARRADEQHVIERFLARARRLDEHREVGARLLLADEFGEALRTQRGLRVFVAALGGDEAAGRGGHFANSFSPSRMSCAVSAPSPAPRDAAAIAAAACG